MNETESIHKSIVITYGAIPIDYDRNGIDIHSIGRNVMSKPESTIQMANRININCFRFKPAPVD